MTKTCSKCKENKLLSEFHKNTGHSDGVRSDCKICCIKRQTIYANKNKEKIRNSGKNYYKNNKQKWQAEQLKRKFNLTLQDRERMFIEQGGCCFICNKHESKTRKGLGIDHNHKTGKIRSLLCDTCNLGLGVFSDNPDLLIKAAEYLKYHE